MSSNSASLFLRFCAAAAALFALLGGSASAQELRDQPAPFSVWLDFHALAKPNPPKIALPIWLESVSSDHPAKKEGGKDETTFRMRLRHLGGLNSELYVRVFFDDIAEALPTISTWTEIGAVRFRSEPLGTGIGLPNSAALTIPVDDVDYVEITVPGDGSTVRGAFLSSMERQETIVSVDLARAPRTIDPFLNQPPLQPPADDLYLYGRVLATLETEITKLEPGYGTTFEFQLDRKPLIAVITFEVLNADVAAPPELSINGLPLGAVNLTLPDLADPGYRGTVLPLQSDMRFRYSGWLRCQRAVPGSALQAGLNHLDLVLSRAAAPAAVRAVEIQLKHNWKSLDYTLTP